MSELIASINSIHTVVRQALHGEISLEERADIQAMVEAMRQVLREQDMPPAVDRRKRPALNKTAAARTRHRRRNSAAGPRP